MRNANAISFGMIMLIAGVQNSKAADKKLPDQAKAILDKASEFELYSLDPKEQKTPNSTTAPYGWPALGKTPVKEKKDREKLLAVVEKNIANPGRLANCFDPRHMIRATHEGKTVDLLICFKCGSVEVYVDGKRVDKLDFGKDGQLLFSDLLNAGVPLTSPK